MRFPLLKSGVLAQYPLHSTSSCSTTILRFLDGSEQAIPNSFQLTRSWRLRFQDLDDAELAELERFIRTVQGAKHAFSFVDPFSGVEYHNCYLAGQQFTLRSLAPNRNEVTLEISQR